MKKKVLRIFAATALSAVLALNCAGTIREAKAIDKTDVENANKEVEATKKRIEELNSQLNSVNGSITDAEKTIEELDNTIAGIENSISGYRVQISNKQKEIDDKNNEINDKQKDIEGTENDLKDASETEKKQYEDMKKRIQYMYECGENSFLDSIFSADNLSDMLSKTEYASSIIEYDKKQLDKYKATKEKIEEILAKLKTDKLELENQKSKLETQKKELLNLEAGLEEQRNLANSALEVKEQALTSLKNNKDYIEKAKKTEEAKLAEQKKQAEEALRRWAEEVAKANAAGIDADEANKRKLEEIGLAGGFKWPVDGRYNIITSYFGPRIHPISGVYTNHSGMDISGYGIYGANIYACYPGKVIQVDYWNPAVDTMNSKPYGASVRIDHGAGVETLYAHMTTPNVQVGQIVNAGDVIGFVGSTGASTGPHLHLSLFVKGVFSDPLPYLQRP